MQLLHCRLNLFSLIRRGRHQSKICSLTWRMGESCWTFWRVSRAMFWWVFVKIFTQKMNHLTLKFFYIVLYCWWIILTINCINWLFNNNFNNTQCILINGKFASWAISCEKDMFWAFYQTGQPWFQGTLVAFVQ